MPTTPSEHEHLTMYALPEGGGGGIGGATAKMQCLSSVTNALLQTTTSFDQLGKVVEEAFHPRAFLVGAS